VLEVFNEDVVADLVVVEVLPVGFMCIPLPPEGPVVVWYVLVGPAAHVEPAVSPSVLVIVLEGEPSSDGDPELVSALGELPPASVGEAVLLDDAVVPPPVAAALYAPIDVGGPPPDCVQLDGS